MAAASPYTDEEEANTRRPTSASLAASTSACRATTFAFTYSLKDAPQLFRIPGCAARWKIMSTPPTASRPSSPEAMSDLRNNRPFDRPGSQGSPASAAFVTVGQRVDSYDVPASVERLGGEVGTNEACNARNKNPFWWAVHEPRMVAAALKAGCLPSGAYHQPHGAHHVSGRTRTSRIRRADPATCDISTDADPVRNLDCSVGGDRSRLHAGICGARHRHSRRRGDWIKVHHLSGRDTGRPRRFRSSERRGASYRLRGSHRRGCKGPRPHQHRQQCPHRRQRCCSNRRPSKDDRSGRTSSGGSAVELRQATRPDKS